MIIVPVPSARGLARQMEAEHKARVQALFESGWKCPHCGVKREPARRLPGNSFVNLLLFMMMLVPGIRYWNWRKRNEWYACAGCDKRVDLPFSLWNF